MLTWMETVHHYIVSFIISVTLVGHAIVAHNCHQSVATGDNAEGNAAGLFAVLMKDLERQPSTILVPGPAAVRPPRPGPQCQSLAPTTAAIEQAGKSVYDFDAMFPLTTLIIHDPSNDGKTEMMW